MHNESNNVAVEVNNLTICYRRYLRRNYTLKEAFVRLFQANHYESFTALDDVSLRVDRGERIGVVGPNGSGKTTLLKAIAGVLPPTHGRVQTRGRIIPLTVLGAGFNAELTGRENIQMNAAVMGVSQASIRNRQDKIVEFAGIGDFIDSPVHTYSSGMKARLGFSIAVELEPDILLLDEVFSVGDEEFRQRATKRMQELFESGITIITVSHSLATVLKQCDRAYYLRKGHIVAAGQTDEVVRRYKADVESGQVG